MLDFIFEWACYNSNRRWNHRFAAMTFCAVFQVLDYRATRPHMGNEAAQRHMGWNDRHAVQKGRIQLYVT